MDTVLNFRDVGRTVNEHAQHHLLRPGLLFRSGTPDDASAHDRHCIAQEHKIATIVDLRTDSELVHETRRRLSGRRSCPAHDGDVPSDASHIAGVQYRRVNLNGRAYSTGLIMQLSYWNMARLVTLYAFGAKNDAIAILGRNVMAARGLIGLAQDSLAHSRAEVKQAFDLLSDAGQYPILVHCTQGKDRTGLIVLLVLLLLDVPLDLVRQDYMLSQVELAPEREARLVQIHSIGLPSSFADCADGWVEVISEWIQAEYGGIRGYLRACGISDDQQKQVRQILKT